LDEKSITERQSIKLFDREVRQSDAASANSIVPITDDVAGRLKTRLQIYNFEEALTS